MPSQITPWDVVGHRWRRSDEDTWVLEVQWEKP